MLVIELLYIVSVLLLSIYGFNSLILTWIYLRRRHDASDVPSPPADWPRVTVQLPVYNELHTVERLVEAAARLDYPRDRLEIQVLDDSTDDTRRVARLAVARLQREGVDVVHLTREDRVHYKAGALAAGMEESKGELVAIFDADFIPPADFLRRVVPHFSDPTVGCVQTRWGHLNREYSLFTRVQALGIDGHFIVEQTARNRAGLFINFNGTAGVWRRASIDDAGGWQGDTLTEDLDLSYRAQLRGWRIVYLPDVVVPAELPAQIEAFKQQQARWAQGSIQTAIKMLGPLLRSEQPWPIKLEGAIHLTGYTVHPLMLMLLLLTLPMSFSHSWVLAVVPWFMAATMGPPLLYTVAQITGSAHWRRRLRILPVLVLLGTGLALNNTYAVLKALFGVQQGFQRTPKFALRQKRERWIDNVYTLKGSPLVWGELLLAVGSLLMLAMSNINWNFVPWLLMYAGGFGYVALIGLNQAVQRLRWTAK